jgi:hypothetical protein
MTDLPGGVLLPPLVFKAPGDGGAVELAAQFYAAMAGSRQRAPGAEVTVWMDPPPGPLAEHDVLLVGCDGQPLPRSSALVQAVLTAAPAVEVALIDRTGQVMSRGWVARLRSVAATRAAARRVAGPLAVEAMVNRGSGGASPPAGSTPGVGAIGPPARVSRGRVALADAAGLALFAGRAARAAVTVREWACAPVAQPGFGRRPAAELGAEIELAGPWQNGRADRFWADPCVVAAEGGWLFVEELNRRTGLGVIRALHVRDDRLVPGQVVLSGAHHLSFPQIYRVGGRWLATVETCAARQPIYTFDELGDRWTEATDLPHLPPGLADPVLIWPAADASGAPSAGLRLVATHAGTNPDAVLVEYSYDPTTARWRADPAAVRVDVRRSRGGGTLDVRGGERAVQDCSGTYGRAFELTPWPSRGARAGEGNSSPSWAADALRPRRGFQGIHTLTWPAAQVADNDQAPWIDGWRRRLTPLGGWLRWVERKHSARCDGGPISAESPASADAPRVRQVLG